jgi:hypothetical protein
MILLRDFNCQPFCARSMAVSDHVRAHLPADANACKKSIGSGAPGLPYPSKSARFRVTAIVVLRDRDQPTNRATYAVVFSADVARSHLGANRCNVMIGLGALRPEACLRSGGVSHRSLPISATTAWLSSGATADEGITPVVAV